jgi:hypothetical protein
MILFTAAADYSSAEYAAQINRLLIASVSVAIFWIITSLVLASIFWKADEERWKAWIPFWRDFVFFKLGRLPGGLAFFLPGALLLYSTSLLVNLQLLNVMLGLALVGYLIFSILQYVAVFRIAYSFHRRSIEWILLVVFFPGIFLLITAFDKSVWHDEDELRLSFGTAARIGKQVK